MVRHLDDGSLRRWQREALTALRGHTGDMFLAHVCPGGGKTTFALTAAARALADGTLNRIVVVVPTEHLKKQFARSAHDMGIMLDPGLANSAGGLRAGFHGYVTTYAQVAMAPHVHARRTRGAKTGVWLDEIHHTSDGLSWGDAIREAFADAAARVGMSGTPFRSTPGQTIPWVTYEETADGLVSVADYTYSYTDALADHVVRPVLFAAYSGHTRFINSAGQLISADIAGRSGGGGLSREKEDKAWATALDPKGAFVAHVIAAIDERISTYRAGGIPDAAGLILAPDQDRARAYADIARRVTGTDVVLAVSDDPDASAKIAQFRDNPHQRLMVAVKLVSEGVDIPRVCVLGMLSRTKTPTWFAQATGRAVRARAPHETATVFLPAVSALLGLAADMESARDAVTSHPALRTGERDQVRGDRDGVPTWIALDASAAFAHVVSAGRAVLADTSHDDDTADFLGLPGLLSPEQTATLLAARDSSHRALAVTVNNPAVFTVDPPQSEPLWQRMDALRKQCQSLVGQVAARTGQTHPGIHTWLRHTVPGPPASQASETVLQARVDALQTRLRALNARSRSGTLPRPAAASR